MNGLKRCERCKGTGKIFYWIGGERKEYDCVRCGGTGKMMRGEE